MSNEAGGIDANLLRMRSLMDDLDNLIVGYILVRIATARLIIKAKKEPMFKELIALGKELD